MPLASEGSKIMAAILDWWYTPENERLPPKNKHHPIEKKRKPWKTMEKKRNPTNHPENIIFHPPPFLGSSRESPTASAAASPATSGADMEQIWREKQLRGKETSPHFCHGNGNILPTFLH